MSALISRAAARLEKRLADTNGANLVGFLNQRLYDLSLTRPCITHRFGGQLRALHKALTDPLEQQTGIIMMGDSITWGRTLPGNAVSAPRNGTLSDPRDYYATPSYANEFKRFIGAEYFNGAAPVLSNWSYSTAGESTATFSRTVQLYTNLQPFSVNVVAAINAEVKTPETLLGYRHMLGINPTGSTAEVTFPFTGSEFTLVFTSVTADNSADYEVFVDGVSKGVFSSYTADSVNQQRRTHAFGYVRNKTVKIAVRYQVAGVGVAYLNLEAVEINKKCTITTQGVIGTTANAYKTYNFGAYGPTVMTVDANFAFIQLGTNDRSNTAPNYNQPNGVNNFKRNMNALLALVTPTASVILMNSVPAVDESAASFSFNMQSVRHTITQVGAENAIDVIDNYAAFDAFDLSLVLGDGLHPNTAGHALLANNIKNALLQA